jgi:DNA-binding NarL/FixJ family response regulator
MFREVLRKVCEQDLGHEVIGEADDGHRAIDLVTRTNPDLVLLDLHLPKVDGFGVIEAIRMANPDLRILVLSSHCDEYTVFRADNAGVQGFVDKNSNTVESLKTAINAVINGQSSFSPAFQRMREKRHRDPKAFDKLLGNRERIVLALIGEPLTDVEIAKRLGIAVLTVAKHRLNIIQKLGLQNTTELVRYAREHGFTLSAPRNGGDVMLP